MMCVAVLNMLFFLLCDRALRYKFHIIADSAVATEDDAQIGGQHRLLHQHHRDRRVC